MQLLDILKLTLLNIMVSLLVFLMIQVLFAQILTDTLLTAIDSDSALTIIIFLGFILSSVIAIGVVYLTKQKDSSMAVWYASLFAVLSNLTVWVCVSYFSVIHAFPGVVPEPQSSNFWVSIFERFSLYFFSIPKILAYYSLYIQTDVMTFWIWTLISFNLCYAFFLKLFGGK